MKKIYKLILIIIFLIPIKAQALTGNLDINCTPTLVSSNNIITCNITANAKNGEVTGLSADIKLSSNLEYVSFETDTIWQGDASGNKIGLYTSENKSGNFNVGILKVKVKDNTISNAEEISLVNVIYADETFKEIKLDTINKVVKISSSNNYLKSLNINEQNIDFDKTITEYSIIVDNDYVTISAETEDRNATLTGDIGKVKLNYGLNIFKIDVISKNNDKKTYTLNITRKDNRNSENKLSQITLENINLGFKENKYEYNLTVENEIKSTVIKAILKDSKSSFINNYGPRTVTLEEGNNEVLIKVSAENGNIRTYKINIVRKTSSNDKKDDTSISKISIDNKNLEINSNGEYKYVIDHNTSKIDINVKPTSNKSTVEIIGNENLQVGENIIIVKVTAEDNTIKEYKIIVNKKSLEESIDKDNYLKDLIIENYNINFNKDTINYKISIKNETKLNIKCITSSDKATYKIEGNNNLKNNSIIEIKVTAEDNTTRIYKIHINKKTNYLLIVVVAETLIIIAILSYITFKKKKSGPHEEI